MSLPFDKHEWAARIHAAKEDAKKTYNVLIFLGPVPSEVEQWRSSPSYVGSHAVMVPSAGPATGMTEGFVHLNQKLFSQKVHLDPESAVPYLKEHLSWRVQLVSPLQHTERPAGLT